MGDVRFIIVEPHEVAPYVESLRELEQSIRYPIGEGADHFFIDHGERYYPFFSELGRARFLLALRGDRVIGSVAGVQRTILVGGRETKAFYLCDLKVAPDERGQGLSRRMLLRGTAFILRDRGLRETRFFYGASMLGSQGDVMRSARGFHPYRMYQLGTRLKLFFESPDRLAGLDPTGCPPPPPHGLDLSQAGAQLPDFCTTAGRKDLRLVSSHRPWPLIHLPKGPSGWGRSWGEYLVRAGAAIMEQGLTGNTCFAIDERMQDHLSWLQRQGISPGATCTVYFRHLALRTAFPPSVHMPTSEI